MCRLSVPQFFLEDNWMGVYVQVYGSFLLTDFSFGVVGEVKAEEREIKSLSDSWLLNLDMCCGLAVFSFRYKRLHSLASRCFIESHILFYFLS